MAEGVKNIVERLGQQRTDLSWYFPENHPEGEPGQGTGGLAVDGEGKIVGIKSNQYRLHVNRGIPGVYVDDVYSMGGVNHSLEGDPHTGIEIESCVFDSTDGKIVDLKKTYPDDYSKIWTPELYKHSIEVQSDKSPDPKSAVGSLVAKLLASYDILGEKSLIDPTSAWMESIPNIQQDKTDHPYVDVMIEALSKYGGDIENFVGHGMHQHIEASADTVHHIARYMQLLSPILGAGLAASPFMHGQTKPDLYSIFKDRDGSELIKEINNENNGQWEDIRNIVRILGTSAGGVDYLTSRPLAVIQA